MEETASLKDSIRGCSLEFDNFKEGEYDDLPMIKKQLYEAHLQYDEDFKWSYKERVPDLHSFLHSHPSLYLEILKCESFKEKEALDLGKCLSQGSVKEHPPENSSLLNHIGSSSNHEQDCFQALELDLKIQEEEPPDSFTLNNTLGALLHNWDIHMHLHDSMQESLAQALEECDAQLEGLPPSFPSLRAMQEEPPDGAPSFGIIEEGKNSLEP